MKFTYALNVVTVIKTLLSFMEGLTSDTRENGHTICHKFIYKFTIPSPSQKTRCSVVVFSFLVCVFSYTRESSFLPPTIKFDVFCFLFTCEEHDLFCNYFRHEKYRCLFLKCLTTNQHWLEDNNTWLTCPG